MMKKELEYGSWPSRLSAKKLAEGAIRYGHIQVDEDCFYWLESIPTEGGRQVIRCAHSDGNVINKTPTEFSVRTRVHEYGGGDFCVNRGIIVFVNDADQCLYRQQGAEVKSLSKEGDFKHAVRYADMQIHPDGGYLVAVKESHPADHDPNNVINTLVFIDLESGDEQTIVSGEDFYAYPRFSPDGSQLTWLSWQHPDMPWDSTTLSLADIDNKQLVNVERLMQDQNESIYQPSWCPDGELHFVSDRSNWWNIYSLRDGVLNALTPMSVEFGFPQWQFGIRSYQFLDDNRIAAIFTDKGHEHICLIELDSGHVQHLELEFCHFDSGIQYSNGYLYFIASGALNETAVFQYHLESATLSVLSGDSASKNPDDTSVAEIIEFPVGEQVAHGFYYPAKSPDFTAPESSRPPLIVMIHGGPTGATHAAYTLAIQFWTSRGFSVVDVNYRGSTGYGRQYRDSLKYQWGVADVADCVAVVKYLTEIDRIDPQRVAIRGGSAGGYTVYRALQLSDVFKAGMSRYGVADLTTLTRDTHKFELRYLDRLIGAWPDDKAIYESRSPINNMAELSSPMLLLQGDEDSVVPPSQSIAMAESLDQRQIPHHLEMLEGEQHGFRQSHNIIKALELELNFYRQIFNIDASEKLAELHLKHSN